ncbi:MAG TPA: alpha-amylase family glycosyl hydrolase [Gemmatimonadaceae bacterium]|jgi:glycosidase|nr:alpha-amylase family glycosyl hydrolase [Gemmatimonadaceae bacterium]
MPRLVPLVALASLLLARPAPAQPVRAPADTTWRNGGVCYEIFVRSFFDSDSDGVGDLRGIIRQLDYVNDGNPRSTRSLGAKCIWLMPIDPSPSYHGYDVTNYYAVNPDYGTEADFRRLVAEAHRRGIAVLVDLVLNHASSEHPFFKEALRDTASPHRDWFRFSSTDPGTRGPWGQQLWHKSPVRDEYYYGIFTSEMPDLNYDDPAVRAEADRIGRFWLTEMGVDGFRLDAVPYLVESGSAVANTAGTHDVLREFARTVRRTKPGAFTVGEVWDSIGTILPYYPDQLDAYFVFEISDALIDGVRTGSPARFLKSYARMQGAEPATRWAPFLRNHDQTRTMTALGNDRAGARLAAELLLTLPGVPFIYYGEEIGMTGDKPDPRLRTPMQWTGGPRAGFSTAPVWEPLQPDSSTANVAVQSADTGSLLLRYRRLVHLRASNRALGSGDLVPLAASDSSVAAYVRRDGARSVLVVANLARSPRSAVSVGSDARTLPPGRYAARDLLSSATAATLEVGTDGRIAAYTPIATLPPQRAYVLQLTPAGR